MKVSGFYILISLLFLTMIVVTLKYFGGSGNSFIGVTTVRQHKISTGRSASVRKIFIVPGQQVKAGDLLIELESSDLDVEIEKMENRISILKRDASEKAKLVASEINYVKATHGVELEKIYAELAQSQSELLLNQQLTKTFVAERDTISPAAPLSLKIKGLRQQMAQHEQMVTVRVKDILQKNETEQHIEGNQVILLERELELLKNEKNILSRRCQFDGVIENVYVKEGEQVPSYTSLLSINPVCPSTVIGYLTGRKRDPAINTNVSVTSYEHRHRVSGKVIGYGSVVQLPEILQKSTAVKAFGREIFIEIDPENELADGEKVLIR